MKRTIGICLLVMCLFVSGCVSTPIIYKNSMPQTNQTEFYAQNYAPGIKMLDCLSSYLGEESKRYKLTVDSIPNTFGNVKGINLPSDFKQFVKTSLGRITNGYDLFDSQGIGGIRGFSETLGQIVADSRLAKPALLADRVEADFVLCGSLYLAQESSSATIGGEIPFIGGNAEVKSYDVAVQLEAKDTISGEIVIQHTLKARIYSAQHGLSVFSLHSGELVQGDTSFYRAPSMLHGLQSLSNLLVGAIIRDLSTALYYRSFSACNQEIPGLDNTRIPVQSTAAPQQLRLNLVKHNNMVCLQASPFSKAPLQAGAEIYEVRFQQYASARTLNIPVGPTMVDHLSATKLLNGTVCLPQSKIDKRTKNIECEIHDQHGRNIGSVVDSW